MLRLLILTAAAGVLAGCGTEMDQSPTSGGSAAPAGMSPVEAHCSAVARERADDALMNGYGFQIEESVFREAYEDCMAWRAPKPAGGLATQSSPD